MGVGRFQDLIAWQQARVLNKAAYEATRGPRWREDRSLTDQIRRASISVMSNIAEGFERGRPREFHQALSISKGSCGEIRSILCGAVDVGLMTMSEYELLEAQAVRVSQLVGALRAAIDRRIRETRP